MLLSLSSDQSRPTSHRKSEQSWELSSCCCICACCAFYRKNMEVGSLSLHLLLLLCCHCWSPCLCGCCCCTEATNFLLECTIRTWRLGQLGTNSSFLWLPGLVLQSKYDQNSTWGTLWLFKIICPN